MKPSIPQGTRDFSAEVVVKRNYIFNIIKTQFELFGFEPLETPAFENLETLMGKYGDEGDKLIFKILNNGLDLEEKKGKAREDFETVLQGKNVKGITERALKYDLTIPFARYVAMNHSKLTFPLKRYQIQPVWRADRPQRGRYREFYQCDVDIVGSQSLFNELELIQIYQNVFQLLNVNVSICINNRKILAALAELVGGAENMMNITIAIDKLDKIGIEKVNEELSNRGLNANAIEKINHYLQIAQSNFSNDEIIEQLQKMFLDSDLGKKGIEELSYILNNIEHIKIDVTLARGLNYYTGTILEVKPLDVKIGSIGGGGRYDDLTGLFGLKDMPGVGISFGVDRIYDVVEELNLFPENLSTSVDVILLNFGTEFDKKNREILSFLRNHNISCELYPDVVKTDKQFKYAEKKNINFVIMINENELSKELISIKNILTGEKQLISLEEIVKLFH
jgi:histidyl-tRNA synthetase